MPIGVGAARARLPAPQPHRRRPVAGGRRGRGGPALGLADHGALALEQGRELFAVPGSPLDPRADGTNALIREGAALVAGRRRGGGAGPLVGRDPPGHGAIATRPARGRSRCRRTRISWGEGAAAPPQAPPETDGWAESAAAPELSGDARILALLGAAPVSVDDLVRARTCPCRRCTSRCSTSRPPGRSSATRAGSSPGTTRGAEAQARSVSADRRLRVVASMRAISRK